MKAATWVLDHPSAYALARQTATRTRHLHPTELPAPTPAKAWSNARDLPRFPGRSFRTWWKDRPAA